MDTAANGKVLNGNRRNSAVSVEETPWGYIIRKNSAARNRARWGEVLATVACMMFGFAAYAQWILPGTIEAFDKLPLKIATTIMFFVFSAIMYLISRRGLAIEVQINTARQNLRFARRNRAGETSEIAKFPFSMIESVFTKRTHSQHEPDQLYVQPAGRRAPILVASGPSDIMENLQSRIRSDFRAMPATTVTLRRPKVRTRPPARNAFTAS